MLKQLSRLIRKRNYMAYDYYCNCGHQIDLKNHSEYANIMDRCCSLCDCKNPKICKEITDMVFDDKERKYRARLDKMNNDDLWDEFIDAQLPDDYEGEYTRYGEIKCRASFEIFQKRLIDGGFLKNRRNNMSVDSSNA